MKRKALFQAFQATLAARLCLVVACMVMWVGWSEANPQIFSKWGPTVCHSYHIRANLKLD